VLLYSLRAFARPGARLHISQRDVDEQRALVIKTRNIYNSTRPSAGKERELRGEFREGKRERLALDSPSRAVSERARQLITASRPFFLASFFSLVDLSFAGRPAGQPLVKSPRLRSCVSLLQRRCATWSTTATRRKRGSSCRRDTRARIRPGLTVHTIFKEEERNGCRWCSRI